MTFSFFPFYDTMETRKSEGDMSEIYDITIVGGGPVGLFAAFCSYAPKVKLIDSLPQRRATSHSLSEKKVS